MKIYENIINHKISTITPGELLKYAQQFHIAVNEVQAVQIAGYLNGRQVNIFDDGQRMQLIKEIAKIAGPDTAREVNRLFMQFIK